jgi:ferredoxin
MSDTDSEHRALAVLLDSMPQGYPATPSGVEIEILERLFTLKEASVARRLTMVSATPRDIAAISGLDEAEVRACLKSMAKKGLAAFEKTAGGIGFKLLPFVVGFYERQGPSMDSGFAALFERYYREGLAASMTTRPSSHRVIPVEQAIPVGVEVMPYERASSYVDAAAAWGVLDCVCRLQKRLVGEACSHSVGNCLALSSRPEAFAGMEGIRAITREGALQVLREASAEGLVHTTGNTQVGVSIICNCCSCSCGFLRAAKEFGVAEPVARSHFLCAVESAACSGCGACLEACQFGALSLDAEGLCRVDASRCLGCGLCIQSCPAHALALARKGGAGLEPPPVTEGDWESARAVARGMREEYESLKRRGTR